MFRSVKVAAISLKPIRWKKDANADRLEAFFTAAAREKPQVIVAPEGILEGYVVNEVLQDARLTESMFAIAEPIDGPYVQRFQRLARALNTCLCFGFAEKVDRQIFNCAIFIGPDGEICGRHHKTMFREGNDPSWTFNCSGETLRAFDTPVGRSGILICNERWYSILARTLVLDGAQVLFISSYGDKRRTQNQEVLARAREYGVPIVEANVGMNLIISKGEVVAYQWGNDQITFGVVDIPERSSPEAARVLEAQYLEWRDPAMRKRREMADKLRDLPDQELAQHAEEEFFQWQARRCGGQSSGTKR
jgi:predicted amidohydrolase